MIRSSHSGPRKVWLVPVLVLTLLTCAPGIHARESGAGPQEAIERPLTAVTKDEMRAIMEAEGYSVSPDEDGDIVWKVEGFRTLVLVTDDGASVMFRSSFGDGNATMDKVNDWNRTKRYSRSYLDEENDPVLELDLDLAGGVTRARIVDFLKTCRSSYVAWIGEVVE